MDKPEYIDTYDTFESYAPGQPQWISSDCNSIAFWNRGTSNVLINNVVLLLPQDYVSLAGNFLEIKRTRYNYQFTGAGTNLLIVVKTFFTKP